MATEDTVSVPSGKKEKTPEHNGTRKRGKSLARFFKVWATPLSILASILIAAVTLLVSVQQFNGQQLDNAHMQATQVAASAAQALDQQRQATLDTYLDRMSDLLLTDGLGTASPVRNALALAEARTYAAVRNLDGNRKGILVRFLLTAGLLSGSKPIISMSDADLSGAKFTNAILIGANLSGANLSGAIFTNADLSAFSASNSFLSPLKTCVIIEGLCVPAPKIGASTDLIGADLSNATNLNTADLSRAEYNTKPMQVKNAQVNSVTLGPTQWPQGFDPQAKGAICVDC